MYFLFIMKTLTETQLFTQKSLELLDLKYKNIHFLIELSKLYSKNAYLSVFYYCSI